MSLKDAYDLGYEEAYTKIASSGFSRHLAKKIAGPRATPKDLSPFKIKGSEGSTSQFMYQSSRDLLKNADGATQKRFLDNLKSLEELKAQMTPR